MAKGIKINNQTPEGMKAKHRYAQAVHLPTIKPDTEFICEEHRLIFKAKDGCPECKPNQP